MSSSNLSINAAISGSLGGLVATVVTHPVDMMKTRLQVQHAVQVDASRPIYKNSIQAFLQILKTEGFFAFYQGLSANVIGNTASWGGYFYIYDSCKAELMRRNGGKPLNAVDHLIASEIAGIITATLTNPIWVCKNRMQVQTLSANRKYNSFLGTMRGIMVDEGIRGLWRGYIPGLFSTIHGAIKFIVYENLKTNIIKFQNTKHQTETAQNHQTQQNNPAHPNELSPKDEHLRTTLKASEAFIAGSISKVIAALSTYPFQVTRSRLQTAPMGVTQLIKFNGFTDLVVKTWKHEGVAGFYRGIFLYIIRVTPHAAITFTVYEMTMNFLNSR